MPMIWLAVSHRQQHTEADCLPACAEIVLDYLRRHEPYERLVEVLSTTAYGTPAENMLRLDQLGVTVSLRSRSIDEIRVHLQNNLPIIAFVNTADLPYWDVAVDHAVVVVGMDDDSVHVNDPYFESAPQKVSRSDFE